jgi:hypothetical protein
MKIKIVPAFLTLLTAFLLLSHPAVATAGAQTMDTTSWAKVAPTDDGFTVLMPQPPVVATQKKQHDRLSLDARLYTVTTPQKAIYTIWSLSRPGNSNLTAEETDDFLDSCIEMVWDEMDKTKPEELIQGKVTPLAMAYVGVLQLAKTFPGREYRMSRGPKIGLARIYYSGPRVYVVMASNVNPAEMEGVWHFVDSFAITAPPALNMNGDSSTNQPDSQPASTIAYSPRDVTQKARLLSRPEPAYTESARKFGVSGTVKLKGVISSDGGLTDIKAVVRLPHGLTQRSIEAACQIRFQPAIKDGQPVSQYIQIEYNYFLY